MDHIRFIGFGEAARAFAESLKVRAPSLSFSCYDILFDSEGPDGSVAAAARELGAKACAHPDDGIEQANWIVLAVTADSSFEAAQSVAGALSPGQTVVDINSVSPARKRRTAAVVNATGAAYVDMAVMAPVKPAGHRTPVLVAGALPAGFGASLRDLDFRFEIVSEEPGQATAVKMVRSVFVKGLEALTAQTLLAATKSGCYDRIMASLSTSYPGLKWPGFPEYQVERMTTHGIRRAAEMRESAATLDELGLQGELVRQIAIAQETLGRAGSPGQDLALDETLRRLADKVARPA